MAAIYDIARMAKVTPMTASNVMVGKGLLNTTACMQYTQAPCDQPDSVARKPNQSEWKNQPTFLFSTGPTIVTSDIIFV